MESTRALLVEIIGVAGAGKTTLAESLLRHDYRIAIGPELELRSKQYIPVFVAHAPFVLPALLGARRNRRPFSWDDIKATVYLEAWPSVLKKQATNDNTITLLDHGPIFKLAKLNISGSVQLADPRPENWWNSLIMMWADVLDIVIWLDAPDSVLMERINNRDQRHEVKEKPGPAVRQFLANYRGAYEQIMSKLKSNGKPTLLRYDTDRVPVEDMVSEVFETLQSASI